MRQKVVQISDGCSALHFTLKKKNINSKIARWWLLIHKLEYELQYWTGAIADHKPMTVEKAGMLLSKWWPLQRGTTLVAKKSFKFFILDQRNRRHHYPKNWMQRTTAFIRNYQRSSAGSYHTMLVLKLFVCGYPWAVVKFATEEMKCLWVKKMKCRPMKETVLPMPGHRLQRKAVPQKNGCRLPI